MIAAATHQGEAPSHRDNARPRPANPKPGITPPPPARGSLSELLMQDLRVENGVARIIEVPVDQKIHVAASLRPTLYAVLQGELAFETGRRSVRLKQGDVGIVFYGDAHSFGTGGRHRDLPPAVIPLRAHERAETVAAGGEAVQAVILQCVVQLTYLGKTARSNRAAPRLLALQTGGGADPEITFPVFPYDAAVLRKELASIGGSALAFSFANMQLCQALRYLTIRTWGSDYRDARNPNTRRIATIIRELRARPEYDWSVAKMACHVGLSRSAFAAAFQALVGESPIGFLTRERMERAAKLLFDHSLSMHEVGKRVGYEIESSFARAFKRHWGFAPKAFVRRSGQDDIRVN